MRLLAGADVWIYWSAFALIMLWVLGVSWAWALLSYSPTNAISIIAIVALAIIGIIETVALCFVSQKFFYGPAATNNNAADGDYPSHRNNPEGTALDVPVGPHDAEDEHRLAEYRYWERQIKVAKWLNIITAWAAGAALLGLLGLVASIQEAHNGNIDANRAWIEPVIIGRMPLYPLKVGSPVGYFVEYQNVGKSPAININWKLDNGYFDRPPKDDGSKIKIRRNATCDGLLPAPNGLVEYPRAETVHSTQPHLFTGVSDEMDTKVEIDQDFIDERHHFFVQGCVAYATLTTVGRSQFCFYVRNVTASGWLVYNCPGSSAR